MKKELLSQIEDILSSGTSIKLHIDRVEQLRSKLIPLLNHDEQVTLINNIRARVQEEADRALTQNNDWGAAYMATGTGKSKIAIDKAVVAKFWNKDARVLLAVPTEKLRDENWRDEFVKWGAEEIWENNVVRSCYASLSKYEGHTFDLMILDEGHNITELNSTFFSKNTVKKLILLTATKPTDITKLAILTSLNIHEVYSLSLDEAVKLGVVAPYDITIVTTNLNSSDKYIKAGRKDKPFFNTEKAQYGYLSARLSAMPNKMGFLDRMRFVYNLKSKTAAAKYILDNIIPKDLRTLVFCGSKEQANILCEYRFYSKPSPPKKLPQITTEHKKAKYAADYIKYVKMMNEYQGGTSFNLFKRLLINRMSCVDALNEGQNIADLDVCFIVQLNSSELDLVQRIGRFLRNRPGHTGKIIILCCQDSVDKDWVQKATANFNPENISTVEFYRLALGEETISFD